MSAMRIFEYIEFLSPHKKIRIFVDTFELYLLRKQPFIIGATIKYSNENNKRISDRDKARSLNLRGFSSYSKIDQIANHSGASGI